MNEIDFLGGYMPVASFSTIPSLPSQILLSFPFLGELTTAKTPDLLQQSGNQIQVSYVLSPQGASSQITLNIRANPSSCILGFYKCERDLTTDECFCVRMSYEAFWKEFLCLLPCFGPQCAPAPPCCTCVPGCVDP